jgi:hypothetical protein
MDTSGKLVSPQMEPIKVLALAIQQEINIPDGNVMLGLENWKIPNDTGLYLSLIYGTEQVIANNNYSAVDANGNFQEVQSAVMLHAIDVDIMSFDSSARVQKQAVLWALQSVNAQNLMEKYQMRIARMPQSFVPFSFVRDGERRSHQCEDCRLLRRAPADHPGDAAVIAQIFVGGPNP